VKVASGKGVCKGGGKKEKTKCLRKVSLLYCSYWKGKNEGGAVEELRDGERYRLVDIRKVKGQRGEAGAG